MWNGGARASMRPHATLTVDNIVDRGSDTLAYLAASGTFVPARLVAACKAAAGCRRGDGADAGAMIRPTGWRSDGSGAAHVSLRLQVLGGLPSTEEVSYSMVTECSSRCRVRR